MKISQTNKSIVYGPVQSRRFGLSLGINISGPGKYCSFNCAYCFRGFNEGDLQDYKITFPDYNLVMSEFNGYIRQHDMSRIDDIT